MLSSITVVIPALNEEARLAEAFAGALSAVRPVFESVDVVIVDDGSRDATLRIAEDLARRHGGVQIVHHDRPMGLGYAYRRGVELGQGDWILLAPGDNELDTSTFGPIFEKAPEAEIVIPYTVNQADRPWHRRILSRGFTRVCNLLLRLDVPYYNGSVLHRRRRLLSLPRWTSGFAYQVEILAWLIPAGSTCASVPIRYRPVPGKRSDAFRLRNAASVAGTLIRVVARRWLGRGRVAIR